MPPGLTTLFVPWLVAACCGICPARSEPARLFAPPRSIADITAILDRVKPNSAEIERMRAKAAEEPPAKATGAELGEFYFNRAFLRSEIGLSVEAISDAKTALGFWGPDGNQAGRAKQLLALQYAVVGDYPRAIEAWKALAETNNASASYRLIGFRNVESSLISSGNLAEAEAYLKKNESYFEYLGSANAIAKERRPYVDLDWESEIRLSRALIYQARGLYREAEIAYAEAEHYRRAATDAARKSGASAFEISAKAHSADYMLISVAKMKARQGRLAEAEIDARGALLTRLKAQGKFNQRTPAYLAVLANVLIAEGRYPEAENLVQVSMDILKTIGMPDDLQLCVQSFSLMGTIYVLERKFSESQQMFDRIDKAIASWTPQRRQVFELNESRIASLLASGRIETGIASARALLELKLARVGETHFETAMARGVLALGLAKAGKNDDALREFRAAIPVLIGPTRETSNDDDNTVIAARRQQIQNVIETYIGLVAAPGQNTGASETFALADSIRGRSVQQALSDSSARASVNDPALARLVRREQDLDKEIDAQLGLLNNVLTTPVVEPDEHTSRQMTEAITKLRLERDNARMEIDRRFPSYADLVNPNSPDVDQVRSSLRIGETMLSFYFGRKASFVWAIPKEGPVAFATIPLTADELELKVQKLRKSLDPEAAMISDIPAFDLKLGYELYLLLLKPVESGWKSARDLIVVTNGALGLLPLSLLPTAPSETGSDDGPLFSHYRRVPWLARTHAVTTVPSAAALRTLRKLPAGKPGRGELIGFGDPYFSKEQETEGNAAGARLQSAGAGGNLTRGGVPLRRRNAPKLEDVDSAELAMLPRLPDTADELKLIALALQADPSKVLNLGKQANEKAVKTLDLSGFKILVFATHGLVPGELNGLTQPALALSSPEVTGNDGDGLLTMEEILSLKLDADWVVLSACNTGAGAGAGAEAASGLGRAFFYAGTRALLVTNWSVHSQSARQLVSDLFRRQAQDPKLTRGEALRQAMMALVDGPGYVGADGKTEFDYAHPLFWAPYSIIGDGGVR